MPTADPALFVRSAGLAAPGPLSASPLATLLVALLATLPGAQEARAETVRLAVGRFPAKVVIAGEALEAVGLDGSVLGTGLRRLEAEATPDGLRVLGRTLPREVVRVRAPGTLEVQGHRYHRELEVRFRQYDGKPELLVVHPLDLETYVTGIVSSELPKGWPLEAYKAQAIAARSFAMWQKYRRLDMPYHMETSVLDQVYGGVDREHPLARQAAEETRGLVMTSKRRVVQAYFHASCGDLTESAEEGWGAALPYLPGSECRSCSAANRFTWTARVPRNTVDKILGKRLGEPIEALSIPEKTKTGRAKTVLLEGKTKRKTISGADLRRLLGYGTLWSTWIDTMRLDRDALVVQGRGSGHGVGLCQWGARGLALEGQRFDDILARYYPGTRLVRLY